MTNLETLLNNKSITCLGASAKNLIEHLNNNNINYQYSKIYAGVYEIIIK